MNRPTPAILASSELSQVIARGIRLAIQSGNYPEVFLMNKILRLEPVGGSVILGPP